MEKITLNRLIQAGWTDKRNINIDSIEKVFKEKGIKMPQKIRAFLQQYGIIGVNLSLSFSK